MNGKNLLQASCVIVGLSVAPFARANLLTNGNFESMPNFGSGVSGDSGYSALTGSQIPGWTIASGRAATVHNTVLYPTISGAYSINMDGEGFGGNNADLSQSFTSILGTAYTLEFDWQGWVNNTPFLDVSVMDSVSATTLAHGNYGFSATLHHESFTFIGTGNALELRVKESPQSGFNDNTFIVDNFSVQAVPEPSSLLLLGLGGGALLRRRR